MLGITVIPITLHGRAIGCLHPLLVACGMLVAMTPRLSRRLIGDKSWVRNAERSMFACYNDNFFATHHIDLFYNLLRIKIPCTMATCLMKAESQKPVGHGAFKNSLDSYKGMP